MEDLRTMGRAVKMGGPTRLGNRLFRARLKPGLNMGWSYIARARPNTGSRANGPARTYLFFSILYGLNR